MTYSDTIKTLANNFSNDAFRTYLDDSGSIRFYLISTQELVNYVNNEWNDQEVAIILDDEGDLLIVNHNLTPSQYTLLFNEYLSNSDKKQIVLEDVKGQENTVLYARTYLTDSGHLGYMEISLDTLLDILSREGEVVEVDADGDYVVINHILTPKVIQNQLLNSL